MKKAKCKRCLQVGTCWCAAHPMKCPRCGGEMELREGKFGAFWGCIKFPNCYGTVTARGTYMRKFSNAKENQSPPEGG